MPSTDKLLGEENLGLDFPTNKETTTNSFELIISQLFFLKNYKKSTASPSKTTDSFSHPLGTKDRTLIHTPFSSICTSSVANAVIDKKTKNRGIAEEVQ